MSATAAGPRTTTDLSAVGASNSAALAAAPAIVHISPCTSRSTDFTSACPAVHTPLSVSRFESLLRNHPDSSLASYVINGLRCGFDIGFTGNRITNQHSSNLSSAFQHSAFVSAQLTASCNAGYTAGPFDSPPFPFMYCSGIGAVPKKNGKLRLIHHLSSPAGSSVNDGIPAEPFSLQYISIDEAINIIMSSPSPVYLSKLDVKSAFRQIPVRPQDWHLLGILWQGKYYYDRVLPFGLRSSPAVFDAVAATIEWIMHHEFSIPNLLHFLDDYLCVSVGQAVANRQLAILLRAFSYLGVPLAPAKVEGPSRTLTFLGIILDCEKMEARLPDDKLADIKRLLTAASINPTMSQRELESLLGKLSFAARVIVPGRTFMRRLWSICSRYQQPHYRISLTTECQEDIQWWLRLLEQWNGKSFFLFPDWTPSPDLELFTDASGTLGWGAFNSGRWLQGTWSPEQLTHSIEWKELYALVTACCTWAKEWRQLRITMHCDNKAVVDCIRSGTSKSPPVMTLIRELFFVCARFNFTVTAAHIAGQSNCIADSLSRFRMEEFRRLAPAAQAQPDRAVLPFQSM